MYAPGWRLALFWFRSAVAEEAEGHEEILSQIQPLPQSILVFICIDSEIASANLRFARMTSPYGIATATTHSQQKVASETQHNASYGRFLLFFRQRHSNDTPMSWVMNATLQAWTAIDNPCIRLFAVTFF